MLLLSHRFVYGLIAVLYAGSCFGLDHVVVAAAVAASYLVLACTCDAGSKRKE